jgi:hypothetical protein
MRPRAEAGASKLSQEKSKFWRPNNCPQKQQIGACMQQILTELMKNTKNQIPRECTQQSKAPNESVSDRRTNPPPDNGNFSNFWERPGDRFEACGRSTTSAKC